MGQDDSCGICGGHYQSCRHYLKEHIPDEHGLPQCGRNKEKVIVMKPGWREIDIDPDDICGQCLRIEEKNESQSNLRP